MDGVKNTAGETKRKRAVCLKVKKSGQKTNRIKINSGILLKRKTMKIKVISVHRMCPHRCHASAA